MRFPVFLSKYFDQRGAGEKEMVLLLLQLLTILVFFSVILSVFFDFFLYLSFLPLLGLAYVFYKEAGVFGGDRLAYASFFTILVFLAYSLPIVGSLFPVSFYDPFSAVKGLVLLLFSVLFLLFSWRVLFGRNYTFGTVLLADDKLAAVRVGFDLRANVKNGSYVVGNNAKAKKNQKVKLLVRRAGFTQARPTEILEKTG